MTDTDLLRVGTDQLASLLTRVTADTAGGSTPCADWTVSDLADHIVWSTGGMVTMARGEQVDWSAGAEHQDDPAAAFRAHADSLLAALESPDAAFPSGMALGELSVHTWDLATALGVGTEDLDPAVPEAGHAFMGPSLTPDRRGDAFGPERPAPDGADAYARLAAFAGRSV